MIILCSNTSAIPKNTNPKINQTRKLERSGSPEQGQAESKDPEGKNQPKCAGAQRQKAKILKNSYSFPHKHLRSSGTQKYPNFRTKRAGRPKYEGRLFFAPK